MSEKDYSPLSVACVRALNDKLYEKRKAAALEIEKMVKDFNSVNNTLQIKKLLKTLGQDFAMSQNPHTRKGGLIGLAAMAIALGKETGLYIDELILPILACFSDSDSRVRYYACESLYNVVKVARGSVLCHFNEIFNALSRLAADPDQHVKNGSELLDRLMKDIVTESAAFDLVNFMPLLRERIYTNNPFARQFIISWVTVLDAVPDINMIIFLPDFLDGLFHILADPTRETKEMCETVLGEFLRSITQNPSRVDFAAMVNIVITHAQSQDELLQFTAITWIKEFVGIAGRTMLPFTAGIITAILPCLAYEDDRRKKLRDASKTVNYNLMKLVTVEDDRDLPEGSESCEESKGESGDDSNTQRSPPQLDLPPVVEALIKQLQHSSVPTKVAVLGWLHHLFLKIPNKVFRHVDDIFVVLLKTLSDQSDQVILQALEVLSEIASSSPGKKFQSTMDQKDIPSYLKSLMDKTPNMNPYFTKFMVNLLQNFHSDKHLLEERGSFIVRQLCVLLSAEDIYQTLSEILIHESDCGFCSIMVEALNTILLTSAELFELRTQLKGLKTEETCSLFCCLYRAWCHNPVATVALCLLTQNYGHASDLIRTFSNIEVTVDFLTEIDKLVQLIESPIFAYLRLELLDAHQNQQLVHALYGLLMILPQSDAFLLLKRRLECVPGFHFSSDNKTLGQKKEERKHVKQINFGALLNHFLYVQEMHRSKKQSTRAAALISKSFKNMES